MKAAVIKVVLSLLILAPTSITTANLRGWTDNQCLATAIHYEARGEPLAGKRAVLDTITNRMLATGKSACSVIFERGQFSWAKKKPLLEYNEKQRESLGEVVQYPVVLNSERYTHFFSGAKPKWAQGMRCREIGKQKFCRTT